MDLFKIALPSREELSESQYNPEAFGNKILYDMCKKYPGHTVPEEIHAKLWIIGRTYAAALERKRESVKKSTEKVYTETIDKLIEIGSELDANIQELRPIVDHATMCAALHVHKSLVDIFYEVTDLEKRSLASKYLHFHKPDVFYIYDAYANTTLKKCVEGRIIPDDQYEHEYFRFCSRAMAFQKRIKETYGTDLTPRELDNWLSQLRRAKYATEKIEADETTE